MRRRALWPIGTCVEAEGVTTRLQIQAGRANPAAHTACQRDDSAPGYRGYCLSSSRMRTCGAVNPSESRGQVVVHAIRRAQTAHHCCCAHERAVDHDPDMGRGSDARKPRVVKPDRLISVPGQRADPAAVKMATRSPARRVCRSAQAEISDEERFDGGPDRHQPRPAYLGGGRRSAELDQEDMPCTSRPAGSRRRVEPVAGVEHAHSVTVAAGTILAEICQPA